MRLIEFLKSPLKWRNIRQGLYSFEYNGVNFVVKFVAEPIEDYIDAETARNSGYEPEDDVIAVMFGPRYNKENKTNIQYKATGKGGAIEIFSTVKDIVKDYVSKNYEDSVGLTFDADLTEPTRVRLYKRMLPVLAKEIHAKPHDLGSDGEYHRFFLEFIK